MAYGRLDVFWPDGRFETYPLTLPNVSVGRSSGCTIVLDTETISRYHFSITHDGETTVIADMDSANGTFIDGARLAANETRQLMGGEELQIGHLRMIYHHVDDQPTLPLSELLDDTQRYEREDHGFFIEVHGPTFAVPPGSHTSVELTVTNTSTERQRYTIAFKGLPAGWARINRPEIDVEPDETVQVLVNIKPLRRSDSTPGEYPAKIIVAIKNKSDVKLEADVNVRILPYSGFGMALASRSISPYEPFRLHIHNQGSAGLPLYVMGRSQDDALSFSIAKPQILLAPGQRMIVDGHITPRKRRLFGSPREHTFDIMVRSRDEAAFLAAMRGHYTEMAMMPRWAALALAAMGLGVIVLLALAAALIFRAPPVEPQITSFQVANSEIARGDALAVYWAVQDAEQLVLTVDGTPVFDDIPLETTTVEIDTRDYTGEIVVELQALHGERSANRTHTVTIYEPLTVDYFEVMPSTLVRDVVQTLSVRWRVEQATSTFIEGLDTFSVGLEIETSYGPAGSVTDVPGIASDSFTVVLVAEDERGNVLESSIDVEIVPAQCVTQGDSLNLYAYPDTDADVVSTVPDVGTILVVSGRDETGQWLRTQVPGVGEVWGERAGMVCSESFNPDNLRLIPTASLMPTPTATASPTVTAAITPTETNTPVPEATSTP